MAKDTTGLIQFELYDIHGRVEAVKEDTAVTIGVFDGVHLGHRELLSKLTEEASPLSPLAVTLTAHPSFVLGYRENECWLDDEEEHLRLLFAAGMKYVAVLPFNAEVAAMTACQTAHWMYDELRMRKLMLGYDSRFGSRKNDDFGKLPMLAEELGFHYMHGEPLTVAGEPVSSSRIRATLADGHVEETATLLGRSYTLKGRVMHGRGVGHTIGFPTANIDFSDTRKMLPKDGVYAVDVRIEGGARFSGMANMGGIPTYGIEKPTLEVHLKDFDGDLYGKSVEVSFQRRIRDILRFDTPEELAEQLRKDLSVCES